MPSLLEAITEKYGADSMDSLDELPIAIYVPKRGPRNIVPSLLVLNDCDIDTAGSENELKQKCQCVEDLDLAQNNLTQWSEIFSILRLMPCLKFVNLSFNDLSADIIRNNIIDTQWGYLKNLVLNATQISWKNVRCLLKNLPKVEELHLSLNHYDNVDLIDDVSKEPLEVKSLKKLHFTGNPVESWLEVKKLGISFPNLESLVLSQCPLRSLDSSCSSVSNECKSSLYSRSESESESSEKKSDSPHSAFRFLRFLNLNNTLLDSWDDIDRLGRFPALQYLRIQGCVLFEHPQEYTEHERRQLLIARLPNIEILNGGGAISTEEREDAERAFIRHYMDKPESDKPERYHDLVAIHGKLDPLVNIDLRPERRVKVTISSENCIEDRCIDVYQTVQELKQKLEELTKIPAPKMRLFYVDQDMRALTGPEEMKFPNKQLYSYNISSGDEIMVDFKK
ncbi:unnamed protein product [Bemisia tabaci]|uniref:Ubiquitin-like domain-containing protein n=1 Tax=Bemisia tabaci TaxID=7038 RepID=A0A9P0F1T2_BEMTA|nr:PREDICTED: tubulin-specific chaperone cofactor E-like protein [Bemisia tabaci]CAH0386046.1 unnamed protein product [Bemisia tabaci]